MYKFDQYPFRGCEGSMETGEGGSRETGEGGSRETPSVYSIPNLRPQESVCSCIEAKTLASPQYRLIRSTVDRKSGSSGPLLTENQAHQGRLLGDRKSGVARQQT